MLKVLCKLMIKLMCRYKYELLKEDKEHLQTLIKRQKHHLVRHVLYLLKIQASFLYCESLLIRLFNVKL